jgi:hypothetical protein
MNTVNDKSYKKIYSQPQIECIKLDNEIALALESDPAGGPGEGYLAPEYFRQEPFKTQLG